MRRRIFVDFEMHPIAREYHEERKIWKDEIIEFGAVMMDNENHELDSFQSYVHPVFMTSFSRKICDLTGIGPEQLSGAPHLQTVLKDFTEWCSRDGLDFTIYAWSDTDLMQVLMEMELKKIPCEGREMNYLLKNWEDFQKMYGELLGLQRPLSLSDALDYVGLAPKGRLHDALWDARNTAQLFGMTLDPLVYRRTIGVIKEALKPQKAFSTSLGDLFDFSSLLSPKLAV